MARPSIAGAAAVALLGLLGAAAGFRALGRAGLADRVLPPAGGAASAPEAAAEPVAADSLQGFICGRVTTLDGATYEGRLRWGGGQEACWGDYFNGTKKGNPWAARVPPERLPRERMPLLLFGLRFAEREVATTLRRPFMARFGDLARIEATRAEVRVTLKSGTEIVLDRFEASDFDDGVRVWDAARGVVDLDTSRLRAIELAPAAAPGAAAVRPHGRVRTRRGELAGFLQWNREKGLGSDELGGRTADGEVAVRLDALRSIAPRSAGGSRATLRDGREILFTGGAEVGERNRGLYVDDRRYGRVLVSWAALERVDFDPPGAAGSGPAYGDYPPGRPLAGAVTARDGRRRAGRLVFDLDESETTETLDAPAAGIDFTIPFALVAAIEPPGPGAPGAAPARVTLASGERLELEPAGDLGEGNAGLLIFVGGAASPEYLPWSEVERIDLDPAPATVPPGGGP